MKKAGILTTLIYLLVASVLFAVLFLAIQNARETARRQSCLNNIKQIGLAMHNHSDTYGRLPVGIETGPEGAPYRSWRTHLYPTFMEQAPDFYDPEFAWDAPKNARLYNGTPVTFTGKGGENPQLVVEDPCPRTWTCPSDSTTRVNYLVVIGEPTAFPLNVSTKLNELPGGQETTILFTEALSGSSIWTEPRDNKFDDLTFAITDTENGDLASGHPAGMNICFASGATYFLSDAISPSELKSLLTIAADETVTVKDLRDREVLDK